MASEGEKSREDAETALAAMADKYCSAVKMLTTAAGQVVGQDSIVSIQHELADENFFRFRCCNRWRQSGAAKIRFASPVGLHVGKVQAASSTRIDDVAKLGFLEV